MTELQQTIEQLNAEITALRTGWWNEMRRRGVSQDRAIAVMKEAVGGLPALSQPDPGERERLAREVRNEALRQMDDLSHDMDAAIPKMLFRAADLLALQMIATSVLRPGDIREAAALELAKHFGEHPWDTMAKDRAALRGLVRTSLANYDINEPTREDCYDAADAILALRTQGEGV